ncbi:hypothetical protein CPter91_4412 [Collimonas pratensis]|uniref:Uncharacterized protein n=1 Tax=Collimonas pratensis TaxID=279113 RepID=A0A127Q9P7_9BURK|nr:hypothetical protein CPter91_4412 [Collimonas pratensis]
MVFLLRASLTEITLKIAKDTTNPITSATIISINVTPR